MWIWINCILLMLGALLQAVGFNYFNRHKKYSRKTARYIYLYNVTSAAWCISYGAIGMMTNFKAAAIVRIIGIFATDAFFVNEIFFISGMYHKKGENLFVRVFTLALSIADFILFSNRSANIFYREKNWTSWFFNQDYIYLRNIHSFYIFMVFLILLVIGIEWFRTVTLRRQKKFLIMLFFANLILYIFSLPDLLLPSLHLKAIPISGFGAAGCSIVVVYAATTLNSFGIRMGNITSKLYDFIDVGVIAFDREHRIVLANPYARKSLGTEEYTECRIGDLFETNGSEEMTYFDSLLESGSHHREKGKDGKVYSVQMNIVADNYGEPYCYLCTFADVTEGEMLIRKLEIANNAKMEFLTSISHEIRTPINAVMGFNELIKRETSVPSLKEYSGHIDNAAHHLLTIVNDLLDMEKMQSGKLVISPESYEPKKVIQSVYFMLALKAKEKGLDFIYSYDENIPGKLFGDEVRIRQIIINLMTNAIKYTQEGRVELIAEKREYSDDMISLIISVKDTGIGIKEEDQPHLYDLFERLDRESNKHIEGTGVGLALTKTLVTMMNGTISVESKYGEGSCFTVILPQRIVNTISGRETNPANENENTERRFIAPGANVLIIDDNDLNREVALGLLKPIKVMTEQGSSGKEMLRMIKEKKYDLILLDQLMPEMNGSEALAHMKEDRTHPNQDTPVIVMTANAISGMREKYLAEGYDDYIPKPIDPAALNRAICSHLDPSLIEYIDEVMDETPAPPLQATAFPYIEGIDWKKALSGATGPDMLREMVKTFCISSDGELSELGEYYIEGVAGNNDNMLELYGIRVHAMKNSAALIGYSELSEMAKELEYAANRKDRSFIAEHHAPFITAYAEITGKLIAAGFGASDESEFVDIAELIKELETAEDAMSNYDTVMLNNIMILLEEHKYASAELGKMIKELQDCVKDFDRDRFFIISKEIRNIIDNK